MIDHDASQTRRNLAHVFWIGGPPDGGKSTVAALIASAIDGETYHFDRHEMDHLRRATPERFPHNAALFRRVEDLSEAGFVEETWVAHSVADMARTTRLIWEERLPLVIEDLLAMPTDTPIIAEGPGFFPTTIEPLLSRPQQAIWLLPSAAFKRASHARRQKTAFRDLTSNPGLALDNHITRDLLLTETYRQELTSSTLSWIEITGRDPAEVIARQVMAQFGLPGIEE